MYKGLCLHPDVAFISNWSARFPGLPVVAGLNRVTRRLPSRSRQAWFGGGRCLRLRNLPAAARSSVPLSGRRRARVHGERVCSGPEDRRRRGSIRAQRSPTAFDALRSFGAGSCLVTKRIANNLRIPLLHRIFPGARFVVLVRDGRAVADSLSRVDWWDRSFVWWYGGTPRAWRAEGKDPWEMCAQQLGRRARSDRGRSPSVPDEQVTRLRYEDLVAEPSEGFRRVAESVGLPDDTAWRASIASLPISDMNEGWRTRLEPWSGQSASPRSNVLDLTGTAMRTESSAFVFVLGTGRCGSSLLHEIVAQHEDVGFISNLDDRLPLPPAVGRWNGPLYRRVPLSMTEKGRLRFAPSEGYRVLSRQVSPVIATPVRDLLASDASPWLAARFARFFETRAAAQNRDVFLHKFTGWPRARFIDAALPETRFIHVIRDGRAVASSLLQMPWWRGYRRADGMGLGAALGR